MSDDTGNGAGDGLEELGEIESLLRELEASDLEPTAPPVAVWAGIEQEVRQPTPLATREGRSRARRWPLAAAAVVVAVLAGTVAWRLAGDGDADVVATAVLVHDLENFDPRGADATATARLLERDGHLEIELTNAELPTLDDEDLELWLIEPDAQGNPVDVAPVAPISTSGAATYPVPDGLDPNSHFVVDISIEPRDGNAAHSGASILRGPLEPA